MLSDDTLRLPDTIEVLDTHTEGEPTRVVLAGWPVPRGDTMAARRDDFVARHDLIRRAVVLEPRGHAAMVGALLTPPIHPDSAAGVIFFNNVGPLGMCGHGTIGVVEALRHLGRIRGDTVRLDTPAGTVSAGIDPDGGVTVRNVPSFLHLRDVEIDVPGVGRVAGDVAYGGNWFFLADAPDLTIEPGTIPELMRVTRAILGALEGAGITGSDGAVIDHVELSAPPSGPHADARNFVLCPGGEYDRSPCGTGTSAVMAARHARGVLAPGQRWRQEGVVGGCFTGWLEPGRNGDMVPVIQGRAHVVGRATLHFHADDPLRGGIPAG